jgi:hypothetical protein
MALNHARLPVPPLALVPPCAYALNLRKRVLSSCSGSIAAVQVAADAANAGSGYSKQLSRNAFRIRFRISLVAYLSRCLCPAAERPGEMTDLESGTRVFNLGRRFLVSCRLVRPWSPVRRALPERGPGDLAHVAAIDAHREDVRLAGITGLGEHNPPTVG